MRSDSDVRPRTPHLSLRGIGMSFGRTQVLEGIDLEIARGSVHAIIGENGAGKSTLGQILCGARTPSVGSLELAGSPTRFRSPRDGLNAGIARISQELALLPDQTVLHNVFVGVESRRAALLADNAAMRRRFDMLVRRSGLRLPADAKVGDLGISDQQKVEILRALARDAELIVMDEPTAALARDETERLLDTIRWLRSQSTTVVFVSHFLNDVLAVADCVTVLRDGHLVRTASADQESSASLVAAMLGRPMSALFPTKRKKPLGGTPRLEVLDVRLAPDLPPVSLTVGRGEIVALAGLVGSGRSELVRSVFGADRRHTGTILVDGDRVRISSPRDAVVHGIFMLPESRKAQGLNLTHTIGTNVALPHLREFSAAGVVQPRRLRREVDGVLAEVGVQPPDGSRGVATLSGGNQQRVMFAKWLLRTPKVLIIDEPTRGVDVGGKSAIYKLIAQLADDGMAILMVSSELEEVVGLSDRVLAMRDSQVQVEFVGGQITEKNVLNAIFGRQGDEP